MRIHLRIAGIALAVLAVLQACGSYSAPNSGQPSMDSTGDTTTSRPPGYVQQQ